MIIFRNKNYSINSNRGPKWRDYKPYPTKLEEDPETGELIDTGIEFDRPGWNELRLGKKVKVNLVEGKYYANDKAQFKKGSDDDKRIKKLRKSLLSGNLFDNNPEDATEYTHYLYKTKNTYIYSKDINYIDRMVYSVTKPEVYYDEDSREEILVATVTIRNLREHKVDNRRFSITS